MERRGVLIEAGVVRNIILWSDESEAQYEAEGWDVAMETTDLDRQPGVDWTWDDTNGFRPPQPYTSWVYDGANWQAPVPAPAIDGYIWNEEAQQWQAAEDELTADS